jgi:molecular chaperone GrpE (heat shock protein)
MSGPGEGPGPRRISEGRAGADPRSELEAKLAREDERRAREDWLRAKAETDNVRRRGQEDVARRTATAWRASPARCSP